MKNVYVIEGKNIVDLDSLFKEFARTVNAPNRYFGRCLQSFDDCLFGGFGLEAPCEIVWKNSSASRLHLDSIMLEKYYEEIYRKEILENESYITEDGKEYVIRTIESAKKGEKNMFNEVVELITSVNERAWDGWIIELVLQ
jgi:RNAse (barnase) inhibitor barstar